VALYKINKEGGIKRITEAEVKMGRKFIPA
jgi:hypothetical protein